MHAFFFFYMLSIYFFDTSIGCFLLFLFPWLASPRPSPLCLVSSSLVSFRLATLRSAFIIGLHRIASLRLAMITFALLCFALLRFACPLFYSLFAIPFYSIFFYSAVFLFRQRHRLPHSALQRLSTAHLLTGTETHTQTDR
jgi:hypothetical protein